MVHITPGWFLVTSLFVLSLVTGMGNAATIQSSTNGYWNAATTWSGGIVPQTGDLVVVKNSLTVTQNVDIGNSTMIRTNATASLIVQSTGGLNVSTGITLTVRGHLELNATLALAPGATLSFNTSAAADPAFAHYWMKIWPSGTNMGRLVARGTATNPCRIESVPTNGASIISGYSLYEVSAYNGLINYSKVSNGGQIDAEHTIFDSLGDGMFPAWSYIPGSNGIYRLQDCVFNRCGRVLPNGAAYIAVSYTTTFERVCWKNSIPKDPNFLTNGISGILQTGSSTGLLSACRLVQCDVDLNTLLYDLNGYTVEDCIFRGGTYGLTYAVPPVSFKRNLMRFDPSQSGWLTLRYGGTMEDCLIVHDYQTNDNPHMLIARYNTGPTAIRGCVFWFSSTNGVVTDGGDGVFLWNADSGTRDGNELLIEHCLFLPNGRGPDATRNLSCNLTSGVMLSTNSRVVVRCNTAYSEGVSLGETSPTQPGTVKYMKSNLFVGPTDNSGTKMHDAGHGLTNPVAAADADYNAGFRLKNGTDYIAGVTGKGYDALKLSGDLAIGRHDLDDVDPQFIDPWRTPATWSLSLGGNGTMTDVMNRLRPSGTATLQDLLDYLREGFRPRNQLLRGAGDPANGSPDIGAVPLRPPFFLLNVTKTSSQN